MAVKTETEYRVNIIGNDGVLVDASVFATEEDADKFVRNAGVGEGYTVKLFIETHEVEEVDWLEIKMEKYRNDY